MIIYPKNWKLCYDKLSEYNSVMEIISKLSSVLKELGIYHLAYSGGLDSTVMLSLMSGVFEKIHTYTISSRHDHPDVLFARRGSSFFSTEHHEFIVEPNHKDSDIFEGDNAVRQLFELVSKHTDDIICCDGIDEFMCGYYDHQLNTEEKYVYYLSRLLPDHLEVLDKNSGVVNVFLPYLNSELVDIYRQIPLSDKVDTKYRKKIMTKIAYFLNIPEEIINRNKYGFVDAFREKDK